MYFGVGDKELHAYIKIYPEFDNRPIYSYHWYYFSVGFLLRE